MFHKATFDYLEMLTQNNNRDWFKAHQDQYESLVREPALDFIEQMAWELPTFAPHFRAISKKVGGSLMRVQRDTRFARDKTPYKTNIGIQFRHEQGKDVHAPAFYLHIAPEECFFAAGCWRPEGVILGKIRAHIVDNSNTWRSICDDKTFREDWQFGGACLKNAPRGYPKNHIALEDLKRKDFIVFMPLLPEEIIAADFVRYASQRFAEAVPLVWFLCAAIEVQYG